MLRYLLRLSYLLRLCGMALFLASAVAATAADDGAAGWPSKWVSKGLVEHPLVGRIYAVDAKKFVTSKAYVEMLARARFVLLGEVHDNPDHHILQALAIRHLEGGDKLSVVFEHFKSDQQTVIDAFQTGAKWMKSAAGDDHVERLFLVTGWAESGWPEGKIYRPLFEAVLERDAKIVAGQPHRRQVYEVAKQGIDALSGDARRAMLVDRPLGGTLEDALLDELEASHCGLLPKTAFGNMAVAQRFRDGHMARGMVDAALKQEGPVALVAGNGHVRLDRGVPWYLTRMAAAATKRTLLSVGHVEVVEGRTQPADYTEAMAAYSLVVFTPRVLREDPCAAMRKRFERKKK